MKRGGGRDLRDWWRDLRACLRILESWIERRSEVNVGVLQWMTGWKVLCGGGILRQDNWPNQPFHAHLCERFERMVEKLESSLVRIWERLPGLQGCLWSLIDWFDYQNQAL
jgi:hypothetical protein